MNDLEQKMERYLNEEMTSEEKLAFEQLVQADPQLQSDLSTYREMKALLSEKDWTSEPAAQSGKRKAYQEFIQSDSAKKIDQSIKSADATYFKTKPKDPQRLSKRKIWLYAAAGVLLLAFNFYMLYQQPDSPEELYAQYSDWTELPSLTLRGEGNSLAAAEKLFQAKEYQNALALFQNYLNTTSDTYQPQVVLYSGICQLELGNTDLAIGTFEQLASSNTLDADKANWYLALAYLKKGDVGKAKTYLEAMQKSELSFKRMEAAELLGKLE